MENENEQREDAPEATSPQSNAHSRRDFLRRAGRQAVKEAVEIGVKVVPGGAIVQQFVNAAPAGEESDQIGEIAPKQSASFLQNPLKWLAQWRNKKDTTNP